MNDVSLTKESKAAIAQIYRVYLERRKLGESREQARRFVLSCDEHRAMMTAVRECLPELKAAGLLRVFAYGDFDLTDKAVIYMENLKKDTLAEWLSFAAQFIP